LPSDPITVNVKLAIDPINISELILTKEELALIKVGPQEINNLIFDVISKIFTIDSSIKDKVIKGLKVSRSDANPYIFTLIANPGYLINENSETLPSNPITVNVKLSIITLGTEDLLITEEDIAKFHPDGIIDINNFEIIQKLFELPLAMELPQAQESFKATLSPISGRTNLHQIILIANPGFVFNDGAPTLPSNNFLVSKKLVITPSDLTGLEITDEDIAKFNTAGTITDLNFVIIQKLFKLPAEMELLQAQESFTARITTTTGNMRK
jgi:hypothetical protein